MPFRAFIRFTFAIIFLLTLVPRGEAEERVRISNGEWLPLFSESLEDYGAPSKIVTDAFALEGVNVDYGFFPWKRAYKLSSIGEWDGTIGWPYSEERAKTHYYSKRPVNSGKWVLFHRTTTPLLSLSIEKLKPYTFGITLGDWALDGKDALTTSLRNGILEYDQAPTDELMFLILARGRIDIFPQQIDVGYYQIKTLQKEGRLKKEEAASLTHFEETYRSMPLYLLLSRKAKNSKRLMGIFNRGMEQLYRAGRLD